MKTRAHHTCSIDCAAALLILVAAHLPLLTAHAAKPATPSLGPWYCAGPFKDALLGLHFTSFEHVFPPEAEAIRAGDGLVDLEQSWKAGHFIGEENPIRAWEKREDWIDGYLNYLPHGPPPMKNETCYLYRTITAPAPMSLDIHIYALDDIRVWLNGEIQGEAFNPHRAGSSRLPAAWVKTLALKRGANRLLVKITSMHGLHGFAFAMPPYTPSNNFLPASGMRSAPPKTDPRSVVERFKFDIAPTPMYDPACLKMAEDLAANVSQTEAGASYLGRLAALDQEVRGTAPPGREASDEDYVRPAQAIDAFWQNEVRRLPAIAFIRCPPFPINAIAPYTAGGAGPAAICVFDPARPNTPPRVVFQDPAMKIFDVNLSFDARTILFSARGKAPGGWHIYEIGIDGKGLKQITTGDNSNISPVLLPNDEIMFVSTRANTRVMCQKQPSGLLYVCERDGSRVRKVSANTLSDHTPQVMNDGRVLFTRWDYGIDKNVFCRQNLWTMNPDGTRFQLFGSNTKEDPNGFWQARAIPGRPEVVCVFGPHHSYHAGMIGLVWNRPVGRTRDRRGEGYRWVTTELPCIGDKTLPWGYQDPFPLNEHQFIVSYGGDGGNKNRLYLLDDRGNRRLLHEAEGDRGCWSPLPLSQRKRPPVIAPTATHPEYAAKDPVSVNREPADHLTGTFVLQDVYVGLGPQVERGEIKALQIVEQVPRSREMRGPSLWGQWVSMSRGTMYARRLIGNVPVETDGSAHFKAPAVRDISFNALDAEGRAIRRMGSTLQIMPGEEQSCIGCHETRGMPPPAAAPSKSIAARRAASAPTYPEWTEKGILDFTKVVQPVLDKHCVSCHSGPTPDGAMDLSGDKTHYHSMAYDMLLDRGMVHYIPIAGTGHEEGTAKTRGSYISSIRKHIETDACCEPLPLEDRRRIYAWIDANVPYYGTYVHTDSRTYGARDRWYVADKNGWFRKDFLPVFDRRCLDCHRRQVKSQTYNYNPGGDGTIMVTSKMWDDMALSQFQHGHGRISMIGQYGPSHRINLTHPEWSRMLTAPLAAGQGGFGFCKEKDGSPVFESRGDPDYQAVLAALKKGQETLAANPRVDMPGVLENLPADFNPGAFAFRKEGWISRTATFEASSLDPRWNNNNDKFLTGEPFDRHWSICTKKEANPWVVIALPEESPIAEVDIVNRYPDCRDFARTLTMWLSNDKKSWRQVWKAPRVEDRWRVKLPPGERGRYIRLGLQEEQILDLKYVFVYGSGK
jgi:hypothetical protein